MQTARLRWDFHSRWHRILGLQYSNRNTVWLVFLSTVIMEPALSTKRLFSFYLRTKWLFIRHEHKPSLHGSVPAHARRALVLFKALNN